MASMESKDSKPGDWENEDDSGLSMLDVLEEEQQLEEDANAVLGGSDDKNCTYDMGYITRQALYACSTCVNSAMEPAGICLACSYECHEGHDLEELYTKRNFRCDCGNSKFPDNRCKLRSHKVAVNEDNKYNQNFRGKYCICHRPYPDPDDNIEDDMIQCIICEDWYHGRHLNTTVPPNEDYEEMVCGTCINKHGFLLAYVVHVPGTKFSKKQISEPSDTERNETSQPECKKLESPPVAKQVPAIRTEDQQYPEPKPNKSDSSIELKDNVKKDEAVQSSSCSTNDCLLLKLQKGPIPQTEGAIFWPQGWRKKLCFCASCKALYERESVGFLEIEGDTVLSYEEQGKSKSQHGSSHDRGMEALSNMNRVQQVEVISEYNDLKTELKEYLKKFADNKKIVREEDIKEFFTKMEARKRQRISSGTGAGIQHFCK